MHRAIAISDRSYRLGESILWDERRGEAVWVDIDAGTFHRGTLRDHRLIEESTTWVDATVGAVALADDGGWLLAGTRRLFSLDPQGAIRPGPDVMAAGRPSRWNDGSADPQGRFVVGSAPLGTVDFGESLVRIDAAGTVDVLATGIGLSNGVAFSRDGGSIFHVDSGTRTVATHPYGPGAFDASEPWVALPIAFEHTPDGLTVDNEDRLWIAEYGGGRVRAYSPDGTLVDEIIVGAALTTSIVFGGRARDVGLISTGRDQEDDDGRSDAGRLFAARPGCAGPAAHRWGGFST